MTSETRPPRPRNGSRPAYGDGRPRCRTAGRSALLSVMAEGAGRRAVRRDVAPGERALLGSCGCADCCPDLVVDGAIGSWFHAGVRALDDHWRLDNLSVDVDLWVVDMEDDAQRVRLCPGRVDVVVPFEFASLQFVRAGVLLSRPVTAIGHETRSTTVSPCPESYRAVLEAELSPGTTYMAVLRELCSGGSGDGLPPSSDQIASRLSRDGIALTRRAVDHHIDYLYTRLFPGAPRCQSTRGWKRVAIATLVNRARLLDADLFGRS